MYLTDRGYQGVDTSRHLFDAFSSWTARTEFSTESDDTATADQIRDSSPVCPYRPSGALSGNLCRRQSFILAIVPFPGFVAETVRWELGETAEEELEGLLSPDSRRNEDMA